MYGLALCGTAAWGQDDTPNEPNLEHLHLPGYEPESRRPSGSSSLRFEVAPVLVSHNPLGEGSETTDELNLSITFATRHPLSDAIEIALDAGTSKTIDNGSTSELAGGVELRTRPSPSGFAVFTRYNVAREYTDFFDESLGTTQRVITGLRYGRDLGGAEIGLQFSPRWEEASDREGDFGAVNAWGELILPVAGDRIQLVLEATAERRWYAHADAAGVKRRDWRFASFLGLDLAGLIETPQRMVHDLTIGVEWLEVGSNVPTAERSHLSLLPTVAIRILL
jgi:hypothetical protein